jgi:hypothetical protein
MTKDTGEHKRKRNARIRDRAQSIGRESEGPFYIGPDTDWPEAFHAIFARDENGREWEFAGKFMWEEDAEFCAQAMNLRGEPPDFPETEN